MARENEEIGLVISAKDLFSSTFAKLGAAIGGLYALEKLTAAAIGNAIKQEEAEVKLGTALGHVSTALVDQANALQLVTRFEDDNIIQAQSMFAMYTKNETQIAKLTRATLDLAQAKGMDLVTAADKVAKSVYTEHNALSKVGLTIQGQVGSIDRVNSALTELEKHYGGQAASAAQTFSGKVQLVKTQFSELLESIGNVVVKNTFFLGALDIAKKTLKSMGDTVNENRGFLMNLVKDGIVLLVRGVGWAIEAIRFFHNTWNLLKLAANGAIYIMSEGLILLYDGARKVLTPFDLIMQAMVKVGVLKVNPFDSLREGLLQFNQSSLDVWNDTTKDVANVNEKYDVMKGKIGEIADSLSRIPAERSISSIIPDRTKIDEAAVAILTLRDCVDALGTSLVGQSGLLDYTASKTTYLKDVSASASKVMAAGQKSVETQLLRLVEAHKFSVGEIGKALMQQVKMELISLAAKAAMYAIFYTAYGLGLLAMGDPRSAIAFSAAGNFAIVAGGALAAAAAVNFLTGPGAEKGAPGSATGEPIRTTPAAPGTAVSGTNQNIVIQIYNPMARENWDKIMEEEVIPAMKRAQDRNLSFA